MIHQKVLFTKDECKKIINYSKLKNNELVFDVTTNHRVKYENSKLTFGEDASYNVYMIYNTTETEWMFDKLLNWFSNKTNIPLNKNVRHGSCTLHKYEVGDKFSKHIDLSKGFEDRRYNIGIQLNDEYDGGEYVCWDKGNEIILSKEVGTALFYHCRVEHEIKEITKGYRWSIVMPIHNWEIIENKSIL